MDDIERGDNGRDSLKRRVHEALALLCSRMYCDSVRVFSSRSATARYAHDLSSRPMTFAADNLPAEIHHATARAPADEAPTLSLEELERRAIQKALDQTRGNNERAADLLGISVRTLSRKLKSYEQNTPEVRQLEIAL